MSEIHNSPGSYVCTFARSHIRTSLRCRRGGIILEAFLALLLVGAAGVIWLLWQQRQGARVTKDSSDLSAWAHGQTRDILVKHGLTENQVIKAYTRERQENGVQWLENYLEANLPRGFNKDAFRSDVNKVLEQKGLSILREENQEAHWRLGPGLQGPGL